MATPWLDAFTQLYVACCLACRHTAVRWSALHKGMVCDWCAIAKSETVWRFENGRLVIPRLTRHQHRDPE